MKKIITIAALAVFALSASTGLAALNKGQQKQFDTGDKDGDGMLTKQEYVQVRIPMMKQGAEKNNKEFDAKATAVRLEKRFDQFDADGDGKLSEAEFEASYAKKK